MQSKSIQLCIHDESRLYNSLDPSREKISDEVYNYLKSYCIDRVHQISFNVIQIISDTPVDGDRFRENLHKAVKKDQDTLEWQLRINNKRAIWECITGISLSVIGFALSIYLDKVLLAIVSFFGSMILREAVVIGTKMNPDIKHLKKRLEPLLSSEIEVILNTEKQC